MLEIWGYTSCVFKGSACSAISEFQGLGFGTSASGGSLGLGFRVEGLGP